MTGALFLVYFLYGLSFFAMGLAISLETARSPSLATVPSMRFLAAFGLIHGTHEWLESYLLQGQSLGTQMPAWLPGLRLALLFSSFISLFLYAYLAVQLVSTRYAHRRFVHFGRLGFCEAAILVMAIVGYWHAPIPWISLLDGLTRYMVAVPAAALAALALRMQGRQFMREGRHPLATRLTPAALGFAVYAATQVFVGPLRMFPASVLNQDSFMAWTGLPVQVIRAVAAVIITISVLRALQAMEREKQSQLLEAQQASLEALEGREALRRQLLQHVVRSQEDERARIARELHDEIAQLLSASSLELGTLRNKLRRPQTIGMVDHLQDLSREMSQSLFQLVHDLRPSELDDLGLVPALRLLLSRVCQPKGLEVSFDLRGSPHRLSPMVETVLFRVAQESLTNVIRHAHVSEAHVELCYEFDSVAMRISDQGQGFDPAERFHPPRGWGLAGMHERVEALDGQWNVRAAPGHGTLIEVVIPLTDDHGKDPVNGTDHLVAGG